MWTYVFHKLSMLETPLAFQRNSDCHALDAMTICLSMPCDEPILRASVMEVNTWIFYCGSTIAGPPSPD